MTKRASIPDAAFVASITDGVAIAIQAWRPELACTAQDAYELLSEAFGDSFTEDTVRRASPEQLSRFAKGLRGWFELDEVVPTQIVERVIGRALEQWR
ncbi:MAG: hypothetical protein AAGJ86_12375 [Pseudomonadota bacterium]